MKDGMILTTNKPLFEPLDFFLKVLKEFIEDINNSKNSISHNLSFCRELRSNRKQFETHTKKILKDFSCFPEKQQVEIESHYYKALNELEVVVPKVIVELQKENIFILSYFFIREVKKTLCIFKISQLKMDAILYPDRSKEILENPELYQSLVQTWGDLAEGEY